MDAFLLIVRLFIAGILTIAGIGKLLDPSAAKEVMKDFGVPSTLAARRISDCPCLRSPSLSSYFLPARLGSVP